MSIAKAGRILGIKASTAKLIVNRYKEEGTFFESK
jgi:transposase